MSKKYLLTPGPTPLPPEVLLACAQPMIHHRTDEFRKIFGEFNEGLKYLFQTKNGVVTFAASGTGAMEASVVNLLSPEDKAIAICGGKFGERWVELCKAYNVNVIPIEVEWGKRAEAGEVQRILAEHKDAKAVFTTLCETSTGVVTDIEAIGKIVKETDAVLVVDAISGLGAEDLQTDNWNVDCVVAGSQKGMMLPPGLSFCSLSQKALKAMETSKLPKYYLDMKKAKKSLDKTDTAYTPAVSLIVAARESLRLIKEEGLENVFKRHKMLADATRNAVCALGLGLFSNTFCNVVTAASVPEGIDGAQLVKLMRKKYGVSIAGGQGHLKGKIIRIAHLGYMEPFDIITGISALELALSELGYKVELGKGIQAAENVFSNQIK
ncbi:MAG: alanine--glyoxylate aminotransferase family protein [Candidatus Omnitrophica bacterium]|nr:alanine--glyoxylate aminotransferase family protein [Candidatus Omnitrophota bacterium]